MTLVLLYPLFKDVIAVVLLSLFLILIQFIVNMVCMANHFVSMVLSVGFTMFLCAPVYYLLLCRVKKIGFKRSKSYRCIAQKLGIGYLQHLKFSAGDFGF